jgi:hypothetical protein
MVGKDDARRIGHKYGPLGSFLIASLLAAVLVPGTQPSDDVAAGGGTTSADFDDASTTTVAGSAAAGTEGAEATGADGSVPADGAAGGGAGGAGGGAPGSTPASGPAGCRPEDGRQAGISRYMPPCVGPFSGDNGGSTARGVQRDKIVVVRYVNYGSAATRAVASAASTRALPSQESWEREGEALLRYFNLHFETYGREVVAVTVEATGTDDQAGRADAVRIAEEIGAFAVYPGTGGADTPAFVEELAARRVLCIGCTLGYSRSFYERTKGFVFAYAPPLEELYVHAAEYWAKRLAGKQAKWAGDPTLARKNRKFGLLWIANTFPGGGAPEPGQKQARDFFVRELGRHGLSLARNVGYVYDLARTQEQATNMIVQMKSAGVTTLAWQGDPLSLTIFTREATRQAYFPEWFVISGYASDTTVFGRAYDQAQWRRAFGISTFWVSPNDERGQAGYRAYHHGRPGSPAEQGTQTTVVLHPTLELLFTGIHMAGPGLTVESFQQGMYRYPETGGLNVAPLRYFRPDSPMALKDVVEFFYDPQRRGSDEAGNDGVGMQVYAEGGTRRTPGSWPSTAPKIFTDENTITTTDDPPTGLPHEEDGHVHPPAQRCRSCDQG